MKNLLISTVVLILSASISTFSNGQGSSGQTYATFLYSFARYSSSEESSEKEYRITILGEANYLADVITYLKSKVVNGKPMKITLVRNVDELVKADLVFITNNKSIDLDKVNSITNGHSTLIVAEGEGLYKKGASVSFTNSDNSIGFEINSLELKKRRVKLSTYLTTLAKTFL
jgi:hypothetical protein